ncbi:Aminotransferase swnA [Colletotrichum siamense]|nr:Aminotransferase swnA [Colletotrichum siamense]
MTLNHNLAKLRANRSSQEPLPTGSAPYTCSAFFKSHVPEPKQKARRWDHLLSKESYNLQASPLKAASRGQGQKKLISLGTARPAPEYFPWESMILQCLQDASVGQEQHVSTVSMTSAKHETAYDLAVAMNYGYSAGSPQALRFVTEHIELIHRPPYEDWDCSLTCGTTSALDIAFRIFCNPGDTILTEHYTYSGTMTCAKAQGLHILGIEMDELGLVPNDLDQKLQYWDYGKGRKPFVLYMIPTGQNPTATTQSLDRRREIYAIAERHDLYILEDDPYYYLQLDSPGSTFESAESNPVQANEEFVKNLPPSYLSLDVSGRVLRMDTASKILGPGLRCGWVTGSTQIIEKFVSYSEIGVLCPSGPSQVMLYKLLDETWGHDGFFKWLRSLSAQYRRRRDNLLDSCKRFLPSQICEWNIPEEGMFLWIKVNIPERQQFRTANSGDGDTTHLLAIEDRIYKKAHDNGVLVSKGSWFIANVQTLRDVNFRLTFAAAPSEELDEAVQRFAIAVRSELCPN